MTDETTLQEIEIADPARLPTNPVVSVQMLTYNHGAYIAQAIEGVLAQRTDFPIELLIAEDCSTDDTRAIAERYQHARPDVVLIVTGPTNIGARANRRRVAKRIRGEFVAFCEGDDYWTDPKKLQSQVDWLRVNRQAGAVHTDFDHVLMRGRRARRLADFQKYRYAGTSVPYGKVFPMLLQGSFVQTCTLCVRADLDRQFVSEFLKDSYPIGDWPLSLYIASEHEIGYLPWSTAVYRRVPGSMMNSGYAASVSLTSAYIPMIEDICDRLGLSEEDRYKALLPLHRALFSLAFLAGDRLAFEQTVAWLRTHAPAFLLPWQRRMKIRWSDLSMLRAALVLKHEACLAISEWCYYHPESWPGRDASS